MLGCSQLYTKPCLGFAGDCAALQAQFTGVELPSSPGIPEDYECTQARPLPVCNPTLPERVAVGKPAACTAGHTARAARRRLGRTHAQGPGLGVV